VDVHFFPALFALRSAGCRIWAVRCPTLRIPIPTAVFKLRIRLLSGQWTVQEWAHSSCLIVANGCAWSHEVILWKAQAFHSKTVGVGFAVSSFPDAQVTAVHFFVGCASHITYLDD
jgi:hypothetical protein